MTMMNDSLGERLMDKIMPWFILAMVAFMAFLIIAGVIGGIAAVAADDPPAFEYRYDQTSDTCWVKPAENEDWTLVQCVKDETK